MTATAHDSFDAFLSHSSKDKPLAVRLLKRRSQSRIKAWIDQANIRAGGLLLDAIQQRACQTTNKAVGHAHRRASASDPEARR